MGSGCVIEGIKALRAVSVRAVQRFLHQYQHFSFKRTIYITFGCKGRVRVEYLLNIFIQITVLIFYFYMTFQMPYVLRFIIQNLYTHAFEMLQQLYKKLNRVKYRDIL